MARDRLAGVNRNYGDESNPQPSYPPSNGVIAQARGGNPYANQDFSAPQQPQQAYNQAPAAYNQAPNAYGQNAGGYAQQDAGNPYGAQQYGQQQGYAQGGAAGGQDFWSELSQTNSSLGELQEQIQAVRSAHQQSLSSTDSAAAQHASQLNDQARIQREECKNQIKRLFKLAKGDKAMKTQVESVKTRFTSLLNEHQVVEKEFRKKVKDRVERQYKIVNPQATEEEVRQVTESDNPQVFSQALLNSNRYGAARGAYREVQERHAEIQKIEKTLTELAQMFNEMAMLVEQQDEAVVNIETQAQGVDNDVKEGLNQTNRAVESARKARRKKWICFWICILILLIVAAVLGGIFGSRAANNK